MTNTTTTLIDIETARRTTRNLIWTKQAGVTEAEFMAVLSDLPILSVHWCLNIVIVQAECNRDQY